MFGPKKEDVVEEVMKSVRSQIEQMKKTYASEVKKMEEHLETIRQAHNNLWIMSEEIREQNKTIIELMKESNPDVVLSAELETKVFTLEKKMKMMEKSLKRISELIEFDMSLPPFIPPAESEAMSMHYMG